MFAGVAAAVGAVGLLPPHAINDPIAIAIASIEAPSRMIWPSRIMSNSAWLLTWKHGSTGCGWRQAELDQLNLMVCCVAARSR